MLTSLPAHETTLPAIGPFTSVGDMLNNAWGTVTATLENTAEAVGDKIAGAYNWTKGEVKGAAEFTTEKAQSLLWTVAIAGAVVFILYLVVRKEVK